MIDQIVITIPELHPSLNALIRTLKSHWGLYAQEKAKWQRIVEGAVKPGMKMEGEVNVLVRYYFKTNRARDIDNYTPKFIMDGLVHAGVIEDDNSNIVKALTVEIAHNKDHPHTEVIITKV